ncbi:MAG: hypothetical protein Q9M25_02730 [Mariprofundaceae bacterium]|nr:hypothetical protein [Mariprofundaceae bacterium]
MQEDMHYYGTYAMARAAGLQVKHAKTVAYAAQYVDDSTANDSEVHDDGGMLQTIATAHTNSEAIKHAAADHVEQRKVWVSFHFFPGNEGDTLSEKLACVEDGALAQEMVKNHIQHAVSVKNEYGLALMGITAHVYADTFSHYGFSGVSSRNNAVESDSFEFDVQNEQMLTYINNKYTRFIEKYTPSFIIDNWRKLASSGAELAVGALGHGGVGTYPDRPFLKWRFTYEKNGRDSGWRNNQASFLQGCEKLHQALTAYAVQAGLAVNPVNFDDISNKVREIIGKEADMEGRIRAWTTAIQQGELFTVESNEALAYSHEDWENQKSNFHKLSNSRDATQSEVYQFHQAAIYHRDYTLKQLLPRHGLVVL